MTAFDWRSNKSRSCRRLRISPATVVTSYPKIDRQAAWTCNDNDPGLQTTAVSPLIMITHQKTERGSLLTRSSSDFMVSVMAHGVRRWRIVIGGRGWSSVWSRHGSGLLTILSKGPKLGETICSSHARAIFSYWCTLSLAVAARTTSLAWHLLYSSSTHPYFMVVALSVRKTSTTETVSSGCHFYP